MKKIILLSDTHGNLKFIEKLKPIIRQYSPDILIHLGDNYPDTQYLLSPNYELIRIPGTWCQEYQSAYIDNRIKITIENWTVFLSHTPESHYEDLPEDPKPESILKESPPDIFAHGHTHHPKIEKSGPTIIINPGHLTAKKDRGYPATYAQLEIEPKILKITICDLLNNTQITHKIFKKPS